MTKTILVGIVLILLGAIVFVRSRAPKTLAIEYSDPVSKMLGTVRVKHNFPALAAAVVVDGNSYDGTSLATALHFNAASSPAWDWKRPIDDHRVIGLNEPGLIWQDGAVSAFRTTIPVPEPSAAVLLVTATIGMGRKRRSRSCDSNPRSPTRVTCPAPQFANYRR